VCSSDLVTQLLASAKAAANKGDASQAERLFTQVLSIEPGNAVARVGIESLSRANRAAADFEEAKRALASGDLAKAEKQLLKTLERSPDHQEARKLLASVEAQTYELPTSGKILSEAYRKPINLEFRDVSIRTVFDALSRTTGINFAFDREVRADQRTTVFLKQTNLEDAIDVILATNQLEKKVLSASSVLVYPNTP
jgi:general secretion pathway protein D